MSKTTTQNNLIETANNVVVCPFMDKCTAYPYSCSSCKHNTGKKSYYEPDYQPYWYPWWDGRGYTITCKSE